MLSKHLQCNSGNTQNWDSNKRTQVSMFDSIHNSIYFYPGYFESKLVVDDKVLLEKDLFIPSNGWVTAIEKLTTPIYVGLPNSKKIGTLGIEPDY